MMLQRVISHLRKQEWTLIAIDFLIVVLGVFIGMQVQDWNADRQARAKAEVFAARLRDDLRFEHWNYQYVSNYYQEVLANAGRAVDALTGDKPMSDEQFLISAYRATQRKYNGQRRATYDELISTGTIGLLADQDLRATAITVFNDTLLDTIQAGAVGSDYRKEFRRTMPARVQQVVLQRCGDRVVLPGDYKLIVGSLDYPCTTDLPQEQVAAAAAALRTNPALLPALQQRFADLETACTDLRNKKLLSR